MLEDLLAFLAKNGQLTWGHCFIENSLRIFQLASQLTAHYHIVVRAKRIF